CERLRDLLQRRRDDVRRLAARAVLGGEVERLAVDERQERALERAGDELAQLARLEPAQDDEAVLRHRLRRLRARAPRREPELPRGGAGEVAPADEPARAERTRERERRRAREQRAVEVEERGGPGHAGRVRRYAGSAGW